MEIDTLSARSLASCVRRGDISAEEVTDHFLRVIQAREPDIAAFLHVDESNARAAARRLDERRRAGQTLGPLAGVPIALKDVLCTRDQPTTCGSRMLQGYVPPYDAHVIERLRAADAILIGKTNMDEFAMGSSTENSAFHITRNPWDLERVPGGSSGGSAAAVAAGEACAALGTDTGGSIRQPAAFCGVVGFKPTYGRVSRYGLIAFASSLDQIGPITRDVPDAALLLNVIAGHDRRDSTSSPDDVPDWTAHLDVPLERLTIGVVPEFLEAGVDEDVARAVREAIRVWRDLGASVRDIALPHTSYGVAAYYLIATAEASSNLARYNGARYGHRAKEFKNLVDMFERSRGEGFGPEVKRRIMLGSYALSRGYRDAYYLQAMKVRRLIKEDFDQAFTRCDVIVGPTTPTTAFRLGEKSSDPLAMYLSDVFTIGANLAGIPGISIPGGSNANGLPIGIQIQGPANREDVVMRVARVFERETGWKLFKMRPKSGSL